LLYPWRLDGHRGGQLGLDTGQGQDVSLLHDIQTGSGAHAASYRVNTGGSFICICIHILAKIPGVARDFIRNEETQTILIFKGFNPPRKSPRYSLYRRLGRPQYRSGRRGEEKHLVPAPNPTPAVRPHARRDATDTAVIRTECTTLHIYFSLEFSQLFIYACLLLPTSPSCNSCRTKRMIFPLQKVLGTEPKENHLPIVAYGPVPGNGPTLKTESQLTDSHN
jgi:hypothetical protein